MAELGLAAATKSMYTLSVIIPTYNRAKFLPACIASVRECGVPAEIILVDDGSTDETPRIAPTLGSDVVFVRQDNAGVSAARNAGTGHAHGEFLAFLDSDDTWRPGAAARLVAVLKRFPEIDVAFADALAGDPKIGFQQSMMEQVGGDPFRGLPDHRPEPGLRLLDRTAFFLRLIERNQVFLGSAIMRRSAFDAVGGFDPELSGAADYEITLRLAHRGDFAYVDEPLAHYLRHDNAMSADLDRMDIEFALAMTKLLEKCPTLKDAESARVRKRRGLLLYFLGYNSYHRGNYVEARRRLQTLFREYGPDPTSVTLWAVCCLPQRWVRGLRQIKRRLTGAA